MLKISFISYFPKLETLVKISWDVALNDCKSLPYFMFLFDDNYFTDYSVRSL